MLVCSSCNYQIGSLGLPKTTWIPSFLYTPANKEYAFHDTRLHSAIENAFQALALDERRPSFAPAVWELCEKKSDSTSTVSNLLHNANTST